MRHEGEADCRVSQGAMAEHPLLVIESPAQLHTLVPQSHELIAVCIDILASVLPGESVAHDVAMSFSDQPEIYHLPSRPRTSLLLQ